MTLNGLKNPHKLLEEINEILFQSNLSPQTIGEIRERLSALRKHITSKQTGVEAGAREQLDGPYFHGDRGLERKMAAAHAADFRGRHNYNDETIAWREHGGFEQ